jgi:hypothetical protein
MEQNILQEGARVQGKNGYFGQFTLGVGGGSLDFGLQTVIHAGRRGGADCWLPERSCIS